MAQNSKNFAVSGNKPPGPQESEGRRDSGK